jgi:hypothetical protein
VTAITALRDRFRQGRAQRAIGARERTLETTMTTRINKQSALAVAATLATLLATSGAFAGVSKPGSGSPVKNNKNPIVNTIHPIIYHPPLHGPGSSHNPIVVSTRDCNDPNTVCRRP